MKSNLNGSISFLMLEMISRATILLGLINHLKSHFPAMHQLYLVLKDHDEPPTPNEIAFASGKKVLDLKSEADYLQKLEDTMEAFALQESQAAVHLQIIFCVKSLTYFIIFTRVHGIKKILNAYLQNGLLHVTNHLMGLKKRNLSS
jgi:hypothetical protein